LRYHDSIVRSLLRLYPAAWRREYGPELADLLSHRPLGFGVVINVAWNAARQRVRDAEPAVRLGGVVMLIILTGVIWNIAAPGFGGRGVAAVIQDSSKTLPTIVVTALASDLYVLTLIACGCWTHLRRGASVQQCGIAAVRLGAIAGVPVMIVGVLMLVGIVDLRVVGPGESATGGLGLTFTYYTTRAHTPSVLAVLTAPLFRLPESWIWGMVGGQIGRAIRRRRHEAYAPN